MPRYPNAKWDPISGSPGKFTGGPLKVVHHKTQGGSLEGARGAYRTNKSDPHFTVHKAGVNQHIDTGVAARALRNESGGVHTNLDGAIQIEIVGYSGQTMDDATMRHLVGLLKWIEQTHGVPWSWPMNRPPMTSAEGYGKYTLHRSATTWDSKGGHYGHSQVPENTHWDPAWTDVEWWVLNEQMGAVQVAPTGGGVTYVPELEIRVVSSLKAPGGGVWLLQPDGAVYAFDAPYKGGANGQGYFAGRTAARLESYGDGYTIVATSGESYDYP